MSRSPSAQAAKAGRPAWAAVAGRRARFRSRPATADEAGFTLVELLVVVVILPMIIGAAAIAIITSLKDESPVAARLSDSINAQLASAYFARDVQGASLVTTTAVAGPYTATNPQPCGTGANLMLSVFRVSGNTANSVSYWLTSTTPQQITRQYCTVTSNIWPAVTTSAPTSTVVISDDVPAGQGPALISPAYFATAAGTGWVPVSVNATNFAANAVTLPVAGASIALQSAPTGFMINASGSPVQVATSTGPQVITCTGTSGSNATGWNLTGCNGGTAATVPTGGQVVQRATVSGVTLSTNEAQSAYNVNLLANPRAAAGAAGGCGGAGCGDGPILLTTAASGVSVTTSGKVTVNISGGVALDSGSLTCTGTANFSASGNIQVSGSTVSGGCTISPAPGSGANAADPYAPYVPPNPEPPPQAFPEPPSAMRYNNPQYHTAITLNPGEYLNQMALVSGAVVTLNPGVYVLDQGISVTGGATLQVASDFAGDGVLLYIPCNATDTWAPSCSGSVSLGAGTINMVPLTSTQSASYFASEAYPSAENGLWIWQNIADSQAGSFGGKGSAITAAGTVYLPGAAVTLDGTSGLTLGRVIAKTVTFTGTNTTTLGG